MTQPSVEEILADPRKCPHRFRDRNRYGHPLGHVRCAGAYHEPLPRCLKGLCPLRRERTTKTDPHYYIVLLILALILWLASILGCASNGNHDEEPPAPPIATDPLLEAIRETSGVYIRALARFETTRSTEDRRALRRADYAAWRAETTLRVRDWEEGLDAE